MVTSKEASQEIFFFCICTLITTIQERKKQTKKKIKREWQLLNQGPQQVKGDVICAQMGKHEYIIHVQGNASLEADLMIVLISVVGKKNN